MISLAEKELYDLIFSSKNTFNFSENHSFFPTYLKHDLKAVIYRIGLFQKEIMVKEANDFTIQTSILISFRKEFIKKQFIINEEEAKKSNDNLFIAAMTSIIKLLKFQKSLFILIKQLIQTLNEAGQLALLLSKNLIINIINCLQQFIQTKTWRDLSQNAEILKYNDCLMNRNFFDKLYGQSQQKSIKNFNSFLKGFVQLFNYLLQKTKSAQKQIKILRNVLNSNQTEQKMLQQVNFSIVKKQKHSLINQLEQMYTKACSEIETCLSCQAKVAVQKMDAHLRLCRSKADIEESIIHLDGQIIAKLYDLNGQSALAKNIFQQKLKQSNEKIKKQLESEKKQKKVKKTFYATPVLSKTFGNNGDSDSQSSRSVQSPKGVLKNMKDLSISQLSTFIGVIEEIQKTGNKIKHQRQVASLNLSNQINSMKNNVFKKFDKIRVKSPLVHVLLNLFSSRRQCMRKLSRSQFDAKNSGLKFIEQVYFHNQYEDIVQSSIKSHKKKKFLTPSERYFSQQQTPSLSNSTETNHICLNDFLIIRMLGKGQFGEIFLVKKKQTGIKYAMKKILMKDIKKNSENIENELVSLSIVNSQFIVKTIFSFTQKQYHYFVMEYLPNGDFFQLLENQGRLYESQCKYYIAEIATGMNDLHKKGIVHRDIKPQNILISKTGHIKISDFGLSEPGIIKKKKNEQKKKMMTEFEKSEIQNKTVNYNNDGLIKIVGSPYFMSPQVLSGETATTISDWWSFGILLFEVLLGWPPFGGESFDEIALKVLQGKIWPDKIKFGIQNDMISLEAKDLIQKLLTRNPEERLGKCFDEIKNHSFFKGVDWNNLSKITPNFQFEDEGQDLGQGKQMSQKASSFRSTNPDLKLIRKDILLQDTKIAHSKKLAQTLRLKTIIQHLKKESL